MYQEHREFKIERTEGLPIWRYMDFWKFLNLINSSKLYFPNTENLGDQNEGKIPEKIYNKLIKKRGEIYAAKHMDLIEKQRPQVLISSWTAGENENFAMWKMYAKEKLGVAIKTNFNRLKEAFDKTEQIIQIGEVNYYDDEKYSYRIGNPYYPFLVKYNYYSFENEVRCIANISDEDFEIGVRFKNIEIDLNKLIKDLYISKFAQKVGLEEVIIKLREERKLDFNIKISGVNDNWI